MITLSGDLLDNMGEHGIYECLKTGWYMEIREGEKVLCTCPAKGGLSIVEGGYTPYGDKKIWKIPFEVKAPVSASGTADNFIMRNRHQQTWTIGGKAGTHEDDYELKMDRTYMMQGSSFILDTLDFTENGT